jgi:transposase-like protein
VPHRYTDEQRLEALDLLDVNRNNVALTSIQTGIPERTLREWRRQDRIQRHLPPDPLPAAAAEAFEREFTETSEAIQWIQDRFIQELVKLTQTLPEILSTASPYHQLLTLMHMIDRIEKLQTLVPQSDNHPSIRLEFVDPDGSIHPTPYWQRPKKENASPE